MELQIVTYEISKRLKELGFDWKISVGKGQMINIIPECEDVRPTQALVCKWFRDVYNIIVCVGIRRGCQFIGGIVINDNFIHVPLACETYEQAEEVGILEAIKIIKNKQI